MADGVYQSGVMPHESFQPNCLNLKLARKRT
jgi:hypothetical protein